MLLSLLKDYMLPYYPSSCTFRGKHNRFCKLRELRHYKLMAQAHPRGFKEYSIFNSLSLQLRSEQGNSMFSRKVLPRL